MTRIYRLMVRENLPENRLKFCRGLDGEHIHYAILERMRTVVMPLGCSIEFGDSNNHP